LNTIGAILALSINPLINEETVKSNTIAYVILLAYLFIAVCFLVVASVYDKKGDKK